MSRSFEFSEGIIQHSHPTQAGAMVTVILPWCDGQTAGLTIQLIIRLATCTVVLIKWLPNSHNGCRQGAEETKVSF